MKKQTIPMKIRMSMTNNIELYKKHIHNWDDLPTFEQDRCMRVNHLRVEGEGLPPVSLPDWEV